MEASLFAFIPEAAGVISAAVAMLVVFGVLATVYVAAPGERGERARFVEQLSRLTDYAKGVRLFGLAALHKKALRLRIPDPDAWDVAQDVAMEAWRSFPTYDPNRGEFASWINGIALNVASDWHQSARAREKPIPPDPAYEAERRAALSPDARHELANHRQDIAALILALPAGARWLLLRGVKRTSKRTGIPWSTLYKFTPRAQAAARRGWQAPRAELAAARAARRAVARVLRGNGVPPEAVRALLAGAERRGGLRRGGPDLLRLTVKRATSDYPMPLLRLAVEAYNRGLVKEAEQIVAAALVRHRRAFGRAM